VIKLNHRLVGLVQFDDADANLLEGGSWSMHCDGYAHAWRKSHLVLMHRLIMGAKPGEEVDHINGDKLDNRRANLRIVSRTQNCMNTGVFCNNKSGVKGVCWHKRVNRWEAYITINKKQTHLGVFPTLEAAAEVRRLAEIKYFGDYRRAPAPAITSQAIN